MTKYIKTALLALISMIWVGCDKDEITDKVEKIKMYVSAETGTYIPWGSETPVECMLVKEEGELEYSHLAFGSIKGFDYVHGHEYELEVRKITLANPPADGSNITYTLLKIISDIPPITPKPEKLPEEAKFKLKMVQLTPFMNLDTPLAAPFDFLKFRILNYKDEYTFPVIPDFLKYYDLIEMSSPVLPDTYCVYRYSADENGTKRSYTSQWGSYFYEKIDFPICLKGYKDGELLYDIMGDERISFVESRFYGNTSLSATFSSAAKAQCYRLLFVKFLFALQLILVCYFGFKKLTHFNHWVKNFYANTEGKTLAPIRSLLTVFLIFALLSSIANYIGRDFFIQKSWMVIIPSVIFTSMIFSVAYIGFRQKFTAIDFCRDEQMGKSKIMPAAPNAIE